jgi:signal transduction histidine kinase
MITAADAVTILLVEDNEGDAELLRDALGAGPTLLHATRLSEATALLGAHAIDVILLDLSLPDAHGLETVARVRQAAPELPIVVLTGLDDEALAMQAVQAGAQDYLVKGAVTDRGVRRAIRHARERQRLLDAARRASHARDVVLGVVAHDLRNPLGAVKMCVAALENGAADGTPTPAARVLELASVIRGSTELMERIIRDLLDVSVIEAGRLTVELEPTSVDRVLARVRELHAPLATENGVTLAMEAPEDEVDVMADAERLEQALGNLLGNALKFTPRGGTVTVSAATEGERVRFAVADTGRGIPADELPFVFDRFWQARTKRRGGAGLGLAIVKGIVEAHGGTVRVESTPDAGSRFSFDIPRA